MSSSSSGGASSGRPHPANGLYHQHLNRQPLDHQSSNKDFLSPLGQSSRSSSSKLVTSPLLANGARHPSSPSDLRRSGSGSLYHSANDRGPQREHFQARKAPAFPEMGRNPFSAEEDRDATPRTVSRGSMGGLHAAPPNAPGMPPARSSPFARSASAAGMQPQVKASQPWSQQYHTNSELKYGIVPNQKPGLARQEARKEGRRVSDLVKKFESADGSANGTMMSCASSGRDGSLHFSKTLAAGLGQSTPLSHRKEQATFLSSPGGKQSSRGGIGEPAPLVARRHDIPRLSTSQPDPRSTNNPGTSAKSDQHAAPPASSMPTDHASRMQLSSSESRDRPMPKPAQREQHKTPELQSSMQFDSPSSARSGPESPDPLNIISPSRGRSSGREISPTVFKKSKSSNKSSARTALDEAMGSSLRPTLQSSKKRKSEGRVEQTPVALFDAAPSQQPDHRPTKQHKKARKSEGPSPIKTAQFYAKSSIPSEPKGVLNSARPPPNKVGRPQKVSRAEAHDKKVTSSPQPEKSATPVAKSVSPVCEAIDSPEVIISGSASEDVTSNVSEAPVMDSCPVSSDLDEAHFEEDPVEEDMQLHPRKTRFSSSLRLALPQEYESDSMEEWEKPDDVLEGQSQGGARATDSDGDVTMIAVDETQTPVARSALPQQKGVRTSIIKSANRAPPMKRFLDLLEDLFEAESSLPDTDVLNETLELPTPANDFYVIVGETAVIKPAKLQQLGRLIRVCISTSRMQRRSGVEGLAAQTDQAEDAKLPTTLADISATELQKLMRLLTSTLKIADGIDPFAAPKTGATDCSESAEGQSKGRRETKETNRQRRESRRSRSRSHSRLRASKSVEPDEAAQKDEDAGSAGGEEDRDLEDGQSTKEIGKSLDSTKVPVCGSSEQAQLGELLSRMTAGLLAADCCLSLLSAPHLDQTLLSEDNIRHPVDLLRTALDTIVYPYVEACSNINADTSHPLLIAWIDAIAPVETPKRGRKKKNAQAQEDKAVDPEGIFQGCSEYLATIFRCCCSSLAHTEKLVQSPSITLPESIIFTTVYAGMGSFFALEPEVLSGSSEAAKASARGRKAMEALSPGLAGLGAAMKVLRLPALHLLRNIFARHPDQRQWIIEEVLTSLMKLPDMKKHRRQHSLPNGENINSITALLLQLVQTAAHGFKERIVPLTEKAALSAAGGNAAVEVALAAQGRKANDTQSSNAQDDAQGEDASGICDQDYDLVSLRKALEEPAQVTKIIATFLTNKVSQNKVVKNSVDFNYASVIENLVSDLLTVVFLPEWPAAMLLLSSLCRSFGVTLDDPKASPDARGVALEHLGQIGAHLRASQLRGETLHRSDQAQPLDRLSASPRALQHIERQRDETALQHFNEAYAAVASHLATAEMDDQASRSALDFLLSQWGSEVSASLVRTSAAVDLARDAHEQEARAELPQLQHLLSALHRTLMLISEIADKTQPANSMPGTTFDMFSIRSTDSYATVAAISQRLVHTASFGVTFDFVRTMLVECLDAPSIGNRTKALRGLGAIYAVDTELLNVASTRSAIETRLSDESTGVREAALNLLSKYLLGQPDDIDVIYQKLRDRIFDAGLAVRKRTLRLLATIYRTLPSEAMRIDACMRMVRCVSDEDVTVQEIAVQTLSSIWLNVGGKVKDADVGDDNADVPKDNLDSPERRHRPSTPRIEGENCEAAHPAQKRSADDVSIIVSVANQIRERPSPLEEVFRRFGKGRSEEEMASMVGRLQLISDSLISSLDDTEASDEASPAPSDFALRLGKIRTIYLVVSTNPAVLSISKAKALLPHLRGGPLTAEEATLFELLLKIFRVSLPLMPKTALALANQLESKIRPWLNNPPRHMTALQELIDCYATVVKTHTGNYTQLIRTFGILIGALRTVAARLEQHPDAPVDPKSRMIMSETALLCEKVDFDALVRSQPELAGDIKDGSGSDDIKSSVFQLLLTIRRQSNTYAAHALRDLGSLFRGFPLMMISEDGMEVMDAVFAKGTPAEVEMLLRIILDFLTVDSERRAPERLAAAEAVASSAKATGRKSNTSSSAASKAVNMKELVGNTDSFADSGVNSVLVQRYLDPILKATLSVHAPLVQRPALEILKFIVMQGLTHPLQCISTLISLETLGDRYIASRALHLHEHLASKHASILASRYSEFIRSSFDFQRQLHEDNLQMLRGYRIDAASAWPVALLQSWHALVRDKRQTRLDFVKAMTKLIDLDTSSDECSNDQVLLTRFVADNLALLDYKTIEEVMVVVAELKKMVTVTGAHVKFLAEGFLAGAFQNEAQENAEADGHRSPRAESEEEEEGQEVDSEEESQLSDLEDGENSDQARSQVPRVSRGPTPAAAARMSIVVGTVVLLRSHLKILYGLSEDKCAKFFAGGNRRSKSTHGAAGTADRPATKRESASGQPLSFDSMPLAFDSVEPEDVALQQLGVFEDMMDEEDAVADDPEDWEE